MKKEKIARLDIPRQVTHEAKLVCLCDSGSRSSSRNGGSLGASLDSSHSSRGSSRGRSDGSINGGDSSRGCLGVGGTVARDVAGLGTLVADLAGGAEGAAVGGSAVTGDVPELAAGVALHGLSLAVASEVVGTTALVAGGGAGVALETTTEATLEAATASAASGGTSRGTSASAGGGGVGAVALREI
jgi:hypothetical protein